MRYCRQCGVKLLNDVSHCPLCDMEAEVTDNNFERDYPYVKRRLSRGILLRIITFTAAVIIGGILLIGHLVPAQGTWALITSAAVIYAWVSSMNVLRGKPNTASIILFQLIAASGLLFFIDYFCGFKRWSVNYVIPFLIMGAALTMTLLIVIRPRSNRKYTIYQLVIAVMGVMAVLLWVLGYSEVEWPVVSAAFVSAICFFALPVFSNRKTRNELYKRFRF